jgi:hypothetical protein
MRSDPTASAALPLKGRISISGAVSAGIPSRENTGRSIRDSSVCIPQARNRETAAMSTTRDGRIRAVVFRPDRAPSTMAENRSTPCRSP